jgi:modulator of FtsH protease
MYDMNPYGQRAQVAAPARAAALPYLRRVYSLFAGGVGLAIAGALVALYAGGSAEEVPPLVAWGMEHWVLAMIVYFGAFLAASFLRRKPGINVVALFAYTFVTGVFLAPALFVAQYMASRGATLDASPVRDAFLLSGAAFGGLTAYTLVTRRNFSFLGAALNVGIWVILGASLLGIFLHSQVWNLAIASVGVLLFAGYILFDTSRLLRDENEDDAVGAALRLFLDVVNLFMFILRILSSSRDER